MSGTQEGASRCLIDSPGLDTDKSILNDINAPDAVFSSDHVAIQENVKRVCLLGAVGFVGDFDRDALGKFNLDGFGGVGGILGRSSHLEHRVLGAACCILEASTLEGGMEKIFVDGVVC